MRRRPPESLDHRPAARMAVRVGLGLLVLGGVLWWWGGDAGEGGPGGVGLRRVLESEAQWRRELWVEGRHLNELELWQIQEGLAQRVGLPVAVLKGLTRRAVNAKDTGYKAQGYLLAGSTDLAGVLCEKLALWHEKNGQAGGQAVWLQRQADAAWRSGLETPGGLLARALAVAPGAAAELRAAILMDLAAWHWGRALFRPEDPQFELSTGLRAVEALMAAETFGGLGPAQQVAVRWRQALFCGRLACLQVEADAVFLAAANEAFAGAWELWQGLGVDFSRELMAGFFYDYGCCLVEQRDWAGAVARLEQSLEIRRELAGLRAVRVDVRVIERRLTERLNTAAMLAYALAHDAAADAGSREVCRALVAEVHQQTVAAERGLPWYLAALAQAELARRAGQGEEALRWRELAQAAYPLLDAGLPGLPRF